MQYNRDPPPYPGHSKQLQQPGLRQSYSGSETSTDVSMSSTENLSLQTRQDPQGEETHLVQHVDYLQLEENSILARLGMPAVEVKSTNSGTFYVTGSMPVSKDASNGIGIGQPFHYDYPEKQLFYYTSANGNVQFMNNNNDVDFSCLPPPPEYPGPGGHGNLGNGVSGGSPSNHSGHSSQSIHSSGSELSTEGVKQRPLCRSYEVINAQGSVVVSSSPNTRSQPDLSRCKELKLVNILDAQQQQQQQQHQQLAPSEQHQRHERLQHQQQQQQHGSPQPQRASAGAPHHHAPHPTVYHPLPSQQHQQPQQRRQSPVTPPHEVTNRPLTSEKDRSNGLPPIQPKPRKDSSSSTGSVGCGLGSINPFSAGVISGVDHAAMASRALQMVELLSDENKALRDELNSYHKKISKLQLFEKEIQKVHEAHESLIRSSEKRETLERTMRMKLQTEVTKLRESNKEFSERLDKTLAELTQRQTYGSGDGSHVDLLRQEMSKKDAIIAKLVAQNRELSIRNDQLDTGRSVEQSTLQEQRTHIDVLDTALNNAQSNCVRMEEELYRRHFQSERIDQLQKALTQIQVTAEKREQLHQQLKRKYQLDINSLKAKFESSSTSSPSTHQESTDGQPGRPSYQQLEDGIRHRDTKLLELDVERSQWEQRYLQESALRELAIDAASQPKEARIAALEQSGADSDRLIAEARSEKMKHLEEVYHANKKSSDLETRVKALQAQLAEKDALVRVFQKHSFSASLGSVFNSTPSHSPHPSSLQTVGSCSGTTMLPISSISSISSIISSSHSHNDVTNRDIVAASAYMGFHTQTGSPSESPTSSLSKQSTANNSTTNIHSSANNITNGNTPALNGGGSTSSSTGSLNAIANQASAVSSGVGALSASANALDSMVNGPRSPNAISTGSLNSNTSSNSGASLNSNGNKNASFNGTVQTTSQGVAGAVTSHAENKKPSQSTKQSLLQFLVHKRLHQSDSGSRSRSSSQSSTSSASGLWQV